MFTNTIDSILKDFNVKIEKLRTISSMKLDEAKAQTIKAEAAAVAAEEAKAEAARAANIASKIEALIG